VKSVGAKGQAFRAVKTYHPTGSPLGAPPDGTENRPAVPIATRPGTAVSWHSTAESANSAHPGPSTIPSSEIEPDVMAAVSLSVSTVKPLGDRVFIKVSASDERTAGGILLPDTAQEKPQVGEVVQVGPGKRNDDGTRQAPEVSVGDKVLYSKYAGTDIKLGGEEFVLLSEKDILAVVS